MSIRSYVRSTDCHCESRSQNIVSCVDVSIVDSSTFGTLPFPDLQRQLIHYKATISASFTRRKKAVNFHQFSTVPLAFIFKLTNQFSPSSIRDAASKGMVFNHIRHSQILNRYRLVFSYQLSCQLVQKIFSPISNLSLNLCYSQPCFLSIFRTFLSPRKSLLCCSELAVFLVEVLRIGNFFSITGSYQRSNTSIQPNIFAGWWQLAFSWIVNQKRDKPTSRRIKFNCQCGRVAINGKVTTPDYIQRLFTLGKPQRTFFPFKSRTSKFSIASIPFLLKIRILGSFCPKVSKSNLKMPQSLLKRYTTNFVEELQLFSFLPSGKQTRGLIVPNSFLSLIPAFSSNSQSFVVNQTNTSPWRAARGLPADVTSSPNGGAGREKRVCFSYPPTSGGARTRKSTSLKNSFMGTAPRSSSSGCRSAKTNS